MRCYSSKHEHHGTHPERGGKSTPVLSVAWLAFVGPNLKLPGLEVANEVSLGEDIDRSSSSGALRQQGWFERISCGIPM